MKHLIFLALLLVTSSFFAQNKTGKTSENDTVKTSVLGLLMDASKEVEEVLYYNKKQLISTIGCKNCILKARTKFESNPEEVVYLDSTDILFEKIISGDSSSCFSSSSFFINNAMFVTALIKWAPIVPITIEFYEDGKLLIEREFDLKYY